MQINYKHITTSLKSYWSVIDSKVDLISDQVKALLITFFISASVLLIVFTANLKEYDEKLVESYYEIDPEKLFTEEEINKFLSLAVLSPTAFNIQNWRYVVVTDLELRTQIRKVAWGQLRP